MVAVLLPVLAVVGVAAGLLLQGDNPVTRVLGFSVTRASSPPQPTIVSGPSGTTASRTATFTYSDSQAGVSFQCSLDGAAFTSCASGGISYTDLAEGSHVFQVAAQANGGALSRADSRNWAVDASGPAVTLSFPTNNGAYNAGAWDSGCKTTGVCGGAGDSSGVQPVQVAILQASSGRYWSGAAFTTTTIQWLPATGTTSWKYALTRPTDDAYTLSVRATDALGNASQANSAFTIDTVAPATPVITSGPQNPTNDTTAQFQFTDSEAGAAFQCKLDNSSFTSCASGANYGNLQQTDHLFSVRAVDAAGNTSGPATYQWTIVKKINFTITGNTSGLLSPGVEVPLNLTFTNPYNFTIRIDNVSVTVDDPTTTTGCSSVQNIEVSKQFTGPVLVPGNTTITLNGTSPYAATRPNLRLRYLPTVNQDACKNTTFQLRYLGTATKP